jgi:hypothetical protein
MRWSQGRRPRRALVVLVPLTVCVALLVPASVRAASPSSSTLPAAPSSGRTTNHDVEPTVAAAPDGTLWATSTVLGDRAPGQDIWKSTDGGKAWTWIADPFRAPGGAGSVGGGDADIAVATRRNANGAYNVYAASLWVEAGEGSVLVGDISLALSQDGGRTWTVHPLAGEVPADDRPWVAADGPCRVYLDYHGGPTLANVVNVYDLCDPLATVAGVTLTPIESTRYPSLSTSALTDAPATYVTAGFGKLAVDTTPSSPGYHHIYIPMMDCPRMTLQQEVGRAAAGDSTCPGGTKAEVYVLVGVPGGSNPGPAGLTTPGVPGAIGWTFVDLGPSTNAEVAVWPATASVDPAGNVLVAWHDNHDSYVQASGDRGRHWTARAVIPTSGAAVYPTIATNGIGRAVVAFYGADRAGDANDTTLMGTATWALDAVAARYDHANAVVTFGAVTSVDPLVHRGVLCTKGDACTTPNSRDLFDNLGAVSSPNGSHTTIVYTSDGGGPLADDTTKAVTVSQ